MKIAQQAVRQLRVKGQQFLKLADLLKNLNSYVDSNMPKVKRLRSTRLKMALAQKKRWAKARKVK